MKSFVGFLGLALTASLLVGSEGCVTCDDDACLGPTTAVEIEPNDTAEQATVLSGSDNYIQGVCADGSDFFRTHMSPGDDPQHALAAELDWSGGGAAPMSLHMTGPSLDVSDATVDATSPRLHVTATVTTSGDMFLQILCLDSAAGLAYSGRFAPAGIY